MQIDLNTADGRAEARRLGIPVPDEPRQEEGTESPRVGRGEGTPPPCSEKAFQASVVALAKTNGWLTYHTFDSRRSEPGFPDLVCVRGDRVVWMELKAKTKLKAAQKQWVNALRRADAEVYVFWPAHWPEIERILQ